MFFNFQKKRDFAYKVLDGLHDKLNGASKVNDSLILNDSIQIRLKKTKKSEDFRLHLYIRRKKKWIFTLKKISFRKDKISCKLNAPDNKINKFCYIEFGITKDNEYLFCKDVEFDIFLDKYIEIMNYIASAHININPLLKNKYEEDAYDKEDEFYSEFIKGKIPNCKYVRKKIRKIIENYSNVHSTIQTKIVDFYRKKKWNIRVETFDDTNVRVRVDVVVRNKKEVIFFEVKPYLRARQCIREALGQLLEYSLYYNINKIKATKLVVVGPNKPQKEDGLYLKKIRDIHKIPIWYVSKNQLEIL